MFILLIVFLVGLLIFLIIKNFILKNSFTRSKKIIYSIIIALIAAPIFYFLFVASLMYFMSREVSKKFDMVLWNNSINIVDGDFAKYEMVDDLIESQILLNKDSLSIKKVLGQPDSKNIDGSKWTYDAGTGGGYGFVDHYLDIYFHKSQAVKLEHRRIKD